MNASPSSQPDTATAPPDAIILAAGKGKRMGSDLPKVLHEVAGRPMVAWVVLACRQAGVGRCVLVIGHGGEQVRQALADETDLLYVEQHEQLGTGHATRMAAPCFENLPPREAFVLAGDGPLIRPATLRTLLDTHRRHRAAATLATSVVTDPTGYGRIIRTDAGQFAGIVEEKDATAEQRAIREINPSYYCFRSDLLFAALGQVNNDNRSGEYYLTDVPAILKAQGHAVAVVDAVPPQDVLSINTPQQLAQVDAILRERLPQEVKG